MVAAVLWVRCLVAVGGRVRVWPAMGRSVGGLVTQRARVGSGSGSLLCAPIALAGAGPWCRGGSGVCLHAWPLCHTTYTQGLWAGDEP